MYDTLLFLHSWIRWLALILVLVLFFRMSWGVRSGSSYSTGDVRLKWTVVFVFDIQFLLGCLLYIVYSPIVKAAYQSNSGFLGSHVLRFYSLEHVFNMVIAVVVLHWGSLAVKKAKDSLEKFKKGVRFIGVTLILILLGFPWPFLKYGRELFRGF
jgi:hypothetical protein